MAPLFSNLSMFTVPPELTSLQPSSHTKVAGLDLPAIERVMTGFEFKHDF